MNCAIEAKGLHKDYGNVEALRGIDLKVPKGSCFGLIGENGAGKTTLIKLMLGIAFPSGGSITLLGDIPSSTEVRRRIGYLPERLTLSPAKSPFSLLKSVARLKGVKLTTNEIQDALQRVGLQREAWKRSVGKFSKGMKQRTGLAVALIGSPELLILDEPTDGIDPMGRAQIRQVIAEENKRGATIFLNSHLLAETERICDHIAILSKGRVVKTGNISSLQKTDIYEIRFVDPPPPEVLSKFELTPSGHQGFYNLHVQSPQALTALLGRVFEEGLHICELRHAKNDLESLLIAAVTKEAPL